MAREYRTRLRMARGRGAAGEGAGHFWAQRLTAVASILSAIFIMILAIALAGRDYAAARALIAHPLITAGLMLSAATFVWHMMIGMQVIIEDYVHSPGLKVGLLMANVLFSALVLVLALAALGKIALGA